MRWRFPDPDDREEAAARAGVQRRIDAWWEAFADAAPALDALFSRGDEFDVVEFMAQHLNPIHPELFWEYGPALEQAGHRLVITAEAALPLEPMVEGILERAPAFPGWEFYTHRVPESYEQTVRTVEGRVGANLEKARFALEVNEAGQIELEVRSKRILAPDALEATGWIAAMTLLGERDAYRWIARVEAGKGSQWGWCKAPGLEAALRDAIASVRAQTPERPCMEWTENCSWALLKLEPERADDYPLRRDLITATVPQPLLPAWKVAHSRNEFFSERFSRHGETFAYLKMDGVDADQEHFADRSEIEDAVQAALAQAGLGAVVGGGTGVRYSYVDVALTDVAAAIPVLRGVLQAGRISKRSWLLFHDECWLHEWAGMWPDSPPPPRPE